MSQIDIFGNATIQTPHNNIKEGLNSIENGEFFFSKNFFSKLDSDQLFQSLLKNIIWKQESMNMYGKQINFPRLTAWYGDNDKPIPFQVLNWLLYLGMKICSQ
jgi:hypothetical protein